MRRSLGFLLAAALAAISLAGCDDDHNGTKTAKQEAASAAARLGSGWFDVSKVRMSNWAFSGKSDGIDGIRAALEAGTLPPRESIGIAAMVDRFAPGGAEPGPAGPAFHPTVVLTTTPWNDDTLLLWVGLAAPPPAADPATPPPHPAVSVEFDARNSAAYRPLGDPQALPAETAGGGNAAILYELAPLRQPTAKDGARYATLHIRYDRTGAADAPPDVDLAITAAAFVETIDDAPEAVRFAAAVAGFGGLLRGDPAIRDLSCEDVIALAQGAAEPDPDGARALMIALMRRAEPLIDLPTADSPQAGEVAH